MSILSVRPAAAAIAALSLFACGGSNTPPASTPSNTSASANGNGTGDGNVVQVRLQDRLQQETATGSTLTEFQKSRLLGHYSTEDGASGFILDRTQTPFKAKLDGTTNVVTVAATGTGGFGGSKDYSSNDKNIWFRLDDSGEVLLFQGPKQHEGVRVVRDATANQL